MRKDLARSGATSATPLELASQTLDDADLVIYQGEMHAYVRGELIKMQTRLNNDVIGHAARGEMELIDDLQREAQGNPAKLAIAARWATMANRQNMRTVERGLG
jgi:hypothetical protein